MRPRVRTRVVAAAGLALAGALLATGVADPVSDGPGAPRIEDREDREARGVWLAAPDGRPLQRHLFAGSRISPGGRLSETVVVRRRGSVDGPVDLRVLPVTAPGPLEGQVRVTVESGGVRRTLRLGRLLRDVQVLRLTDSLDQPRLPVTLTVHLPRSASARTAAAATHFELALTASDAPPAPGTEAGADTGTAPGSGLAPGGGVAPADRGAPAPAAPTLPVVLLVLSSLIGAGLALLVGWRKGRRTAAARLLTPPTA